MARLSLGEAWNEAAAFVRREAHLIFPLAFLLVAVPTAFMGALIPDPGPNGMLEPGAWMLAIIPMLVLAMIAQIAIAFLATRVGASVGEALSRGASRFPSLLGAGLILAFAAAILAFVIILVAAALIPGALANPPDPDAMRTVLLILLVVMFPIGLYFSARLLVTTPVAAAEPGGPLALLRRSWALTRGHVGALIGFLLLVVILVGVVNYVISRVGGSLVIAMAGQPTDGSVSNMIILLIGALLQTVITVYLTSLIARVYAQLAAEPSKGI